MIFMSLILRLLFPDLVCHCRELEIHGDILAFLLIKLSHLLLEPFTVFR
ncbi:unnamed protein product [Brassica oleracea]